MELFKILGSIAIDNDQANQALDDTAQKAGDTSNEVESTFSKIGAGALTIAKGIVTAGAALGGAWIAAIEGSREYRTEMGKLDTAFITNGHSSEAAKQTYSDLNAVLGDTGQAVEAAQHLAKLTDNEKDLQTWTNICTGVYATFGASLPIEGLTEAANETAKTGILTGGLTDAINWAGISEEEFQAKLDACTNEQERQKLIMDTLNGTYSKASEQYKATNKDVMDAQRAQERLTDAFAELGRVGEPILTAIKTKVADMVQAAVPHLENLIQKVKDAKKWMRDNKKTVDIWKAAIVGAAAAAGSFVLILKWSAIMKAAKTAILGVRGAVLLLNAAMKANIIGLIVSLVIGLVAAFITLWKNNEGFRKFWINLWNKIKSSCSSAITGIKNKFNDLKDAAGRVKKWFEDIRKSVTDKIESARNAVKKAIDKIKGYFPLSIGKIFSNLKIPKISVSGGKAPYGIAGKGKMPSFDVKWNAEGGILTKPTIFGMAGNTLLGGGEAGHEAIAPIDTLQAYIRDAVNEKDNAIIQALIDQNQRMMDFLSRMMPRAVQLDSGALVGELTPAIDRTLSSRWEHTKRGNTR
ncbi:MAG: phage tail tape measure protein [Clostridia bacterium]|nr:phage tail tape measure protein [Clostridia bacterium]